MTGPLVTVDWLKENKSTVTIVDARNPEEYGKGHIPGAINVDLFALHWWDSTPEGLKGLKAQHEEAFGKAGLSHDDTVVFYEANSGMLAARGYFIAELFGQDTAILDGGLNAWKAAGLEVATEPTVKPATTYTAEWHPDATAGIEDVKAAIGTDAVILDTRTEAEYLGKNVRAKRGGAMPEAIHLDFGSNLAEDGTFKPANDLRNMYLEKGVTPDDEVITYCHGGYRAANSYVALKIAGYTNVKMYVSSWGEWGNQDDTPIETPEQ